MIKKETYDFLKSVLTLFSGSSISQLISIVVLIVLQRFFYSPEEYAPFRLFFEFSIVFSSIGALRLESGLVLEKNNENTLSLLRVCMRFCIISSLIGGLIFTLYFIREIKTFNSEWLIIFLMPVAIFSAGIIQIYQSFFIKYKEFLTISSSKIIQSLTAGISQITSGLLGLNFTGLIFGRIIGLLSADFNYLKKFFGGFRFPEINKQKERYLIIKHKKFIQFTSPGFFIGNSINLIILMLFANYYGNQFTGLTAAAIQYFGLVIMLFSSSFSQVYYNEIAQINNPKELISSYTFWIKRLFILSIVGWVVLFFVPSSLITFVLGDKWSELLNIIKIISPWMGIMFVSSSLSYIFIRLGKQKEILFFDIFHLVLIALAFFFGNHIFKNKISTLYVITFVQSAFYIASLILAYNFLYKNLEQEKV